MHLTNKSGVLAYKPHLQLENMCRCQDLGVSIRSFCGLDLSVVYGHALNSTILLVVVVCTCIFYKPHPPVTS